MNELPELNSPIYNTTDPCTLEDIETIDPQYKVEWTQYRYRFCADIRSIKRIFDTDHTILPWSIDFCTGVIASQDPDEYKRIFDMRNVPELVSKIEAFSFSGPVFESEPTPPFHTRFIRGIDELIGDSYVYGALINRLLKAKKTLIYQRVCSSMLEVLYEMRSSEIEISEEHDMIRDVFFNYCYMTYSVTSFHMSREEHLMYLLDLLQRFHRIVGEPARFIIQMVMMSV